MSDRLGDRVWLIGLIVVALLGGIGYSTAAAQLEEINIPVVITGGIPEEWNLEAYSARHFTMHFQRGDEIRLSANADGTGNIEVHPSLEIKVIHPNGTIAGRVIPGGKREPQDITSMFAVGKNEVFVDLFRSFPDLELKPQLRFDPTPPVEAGEEVKVYAEVMNSGASPADRFFVAFLYSQIGEQKYTEFDTVIVRSLMAGEQREILGIFDTSGLDKGKYEICVDLDLDNFVEELDETNNRYCTSLPFEITEPESAAELSTVNLEAKALSIIRKAPLALVPAAISTRGYVSSSSLWLVRKTKTSASRLIRTMTRETAQLQRESTGSRGSWNTSIIFRKLKRALRYAPHPRRSGMAQTLIDNAIELIWNIDFSELIEQVKGGLPELRGEIEALIALNEAVEEPGKETLNEIGNLYKLLCGLDPYAPDCEGVMLVPPVPKTWPQIIMELEEIVVLLERARDEIPDNPAEAVRLIREAAILLSSSLKEMDEDWGQVDEHLAKIRGQVRLLYRALRRGSRYSPRAQDKGDPAFELYPNLIRSGLPVEVTVRGMGVESIKLQIFALDGKLVLNKGAEGNYLQVSPLDDQGRPLANGVYLYVVTV